MLTGLFLKGSLIGFSIAMPIGPVGVVCIQHSLRQGILAGLIAGLGAALADAFFGCMAGFGISLFSQFLMRYQILFQTIGAVLLCYLGIKVFKSAAPTIASSSPVIKISRTRIFLSTFALTLTNPLTFICFTAIYTNLGITPSNDEILPGIILTFGILLGAEIWWLLLTFGVAFIGKKFQLTSTPFLNRISGSLLTGCGCLASFSVLRHLLYLT